MTGFPGFLGSALLPRLLARRDGARAVCLVQPQHLGTARARVGEIEAAHPFTAGRIDLVEGDITVPGLGMDPDTRRGLETEVTEVWHLAAVYDLTVAEAIATRVNVDGTARVLQFCEGLPGLTRLQYVSTCYVSGRHEGEFGEDDLEEGQVFLNHYESTKFEAEVLVRKATAGGLPTTVYRPGIVVGDSKTGETQKYDPTSWPASCAASPVRSRSSRPSATSTGCGSPWCRATSSSTRWTSSRSWTGPWAGRTPSPTPTRRRCVASWTPSPGTCTSG